MERLVDVLQLSGDWHQQRSKRKRLSRCRHVRQATSTGPRLSRISFLPRTTPHASVTVTSDGELFVGRGAVNVDSLADAMDATDSELDHSGQRAWVHVSPAPYPFATLFFVDLEERLDLPLTAIAVIWIDPASKWTSKCFLGEAQHTGRTICAGMNKSIYQRCCNSTRPISFHTLEKHIHQEHSGVEHRFVMFQDVHSEGQESEDSVEARANLQVSWSLKAQQVCTYCLQTALGVILAVEKSASVGWKGTTMHAGLNTS
ncbi:uncharacterized protein LAESUDRAFT_715815 [Laetiporus sulphureus 93-53]|uniref:Uncharacterized protein n=1 Tax=Laetiporus sulphureus 93-53 TaxID=1314785 RepID=A0A165D3X0_9APHY|nr:uncharacterized protein LAESUDRAFT_715815 [Laetiporus sulphureus 93-53]KZT04106.1 hypothetical protein LAESUDRAFT_715815 [Laetiporus sulphureus 93-53]